MYIGRYDLFCTSRLLMNIEIVNDIEIKSCTFPF